MAKLANGFTAKRIEALKLFGKHQIIKSQEHVRSTTKSWHALDRVANGVDEDGIPKFRTEFTRLDARGFEQAVNWLNKEGYIIRKPYAWADFGSTYKISQKGRLYLDGLETNGSGGASTNSDS